MPLQHVEATTEKAEGAPLAERYRREDLDRIAAVASRLQEERREQLTAAEVEAIGAELGISPEFMREAMARVASHAAEQAVPRVKQRSGRAVWVSALTAMLLTMSLIGMVWERQAEAVDAQTQAATTQAIAARDAVSLRAAALPGPFSAVSLRPLANQSLDRPIHGKGTELDTLPLGVTKLGGSYFRIEPGIVHLRGAHARNLPAAVDGIRIGKKVSRLHLLHSTGYGAQIRLPAGTEIGEYVVRYADGSTARIPIVYGEDLVDWWEHPGEPPLTRGNVAWVGTVAATDEHRVRLFHSEWVNPHPEKKFAALDFHSHGTECDPFLVAVSTER